MKVDRPGAFIDVLVLAVLGLGIMVPARSPQAAKVPPQGRSDPAFSQPSLAPGVDYTVPTEAEVKAVLDRIGDHFVPSTPYHIIDTATGAVLSDLSTPTKTAGIDNRNGEFNDWTYSMGVVLAGMLQVTDVTGDASFQAYALKNFDFIFDHLDFFRRQAKAFGLQSYGYRRLLEMRELDDRAAIGAAFVKAFAKRADPRHREGIALVDEHIAKRQMRLGDGTLARPRPVPVALWIDDAYMSIPFLAQMGKLTGERRYFDDAARQVFGMSERLFDRGKNLYDHSWFQLAPDDARYFWGRGAGWMLMAMAELLTAMPADHPDRARVLEQFRRSVQGVANPLDLARPSETIALAGADLQTLLGVQDVRTVRVRDEAAGKDLLTQAIDLDDDGKFDQVIVQVDLAPRETRTLALSVGERRIATREEYKAYGRFVRERRDDFAWENDRTAHRMYGAALET